MSEVQKFLNALRSGFDHMFIVREGAPIAEFWESFNSAYQEAAQPRNSGDVAPMGESKSSGDLAQRA